MPSLKDMRRWLRGERIAGLPAHKSKQPKQQVSQRDDGSDERDADDEQQGGLDVRKIKQRSSAGWAGRAKYRLMEDERDAILMFGKYKGAKVSVMAVAGGHRGGRDYLEWMLTQDFPRKLLTVIEAHLFGGK